MRLHSPPEFIMSCAISAPVFWGPCGVSSPGPLKESGLRARAARPAAAGTGRKKKRRRRDVWSVGIQMKYFGSLRRLPQ